MSIRAVRFAVPVTADVQDRHLGRLGRALAERGWTTTTPSASSGLWLRVFHPVIPRVGESVCVGRKRVRLYYYDSSGDVLGRVGDLPRVLAGIEARLEPCRRAADVRRMIA
ncbi:hypothetical protein [Actinomadura rupiterrae]|uniref:hypothetical protein n=1 Tax=Actinomadura rupiterrae TaxID=559627 RepID=UPI0020A4FBA2|nr:hypothetical protein [Actinomadura rupiterrae]MCP2336446.1 hypothetical protein [Actinomadura rupiterrae]